MQGLRVANEDLAGDQIPLALYVLDEAFEAYNGLLSGEVHTMTEKLILLANIILNELNSGDRDPEWDYIWNYQNLLSTFTDFRSDCGDDFKEELSEKMIKHWSSTKINMIVDGSQPLTEEDLEEFAEAAGIDMDAYSYIELYEAGVAIGWAIFGYEHFNEPPYNLVKIFRDQKDMDIYRKTELIGCI